MIDVNELLIKFYFAANVPQQGFISPTQVNQIINLASDSLFKQRLGYPEQAEFQTAIPKVSYHRTSKIHTDLNPFRIKKDIPITANKIASSVLPNDLHIITNIRFDTFIQDKDIRTKKILKKCGCQECEVEKKKGVSYRKMSGDVDLVEEDKWANRISSSIIKSACYCPYADGIEFYFPIKGVRSITMSYLKRPSDANWDYTIVNGVPKYNPTGSKHLEWDSILTDEIISRMVKIYSKSVSDNFGLQYSQSKITNGE